MFSSGHLSSEFFVYESRKMMVLSSEYVIPLTTLVERSINELQRFRSRASSDDHSALEIVRRALVEQTNEAWSALQQCFSETIRVWKIGRAHV